MPVRNGNPSDLQIHFQVVRKDVCVSGQSLRISAAELERLGNKSVRKGIHLYTKGGRGLLPKDAFNTVVEDGTYTILLLPPGEQLHTDEKLIRRDSMSETEQPRKKPRLGTRRP
jgi:hypothetical protein